MQSSSNSSVPQKIAVIGSGIAGLTAAWLLSRKHEVTVFEANDYIGGHTHTVQADIAGKSYAVDTGFIVCNDRNYPNFLNMMDQLGVQLQPSEMSFSVRNEALNLEYNGHNLNSLFSQRRNLFKPSFYRLIRDILRFNSDAKTLLKSNKIESITLTEYLASRGFGSSFRDNYLLPMVAAIWSCSVQQAGNFPIHLFLKFFQHHGLLDITNRPQWSVLKGGSQSYIEPITRSFANNIRLRAPVLLVQRNSASIEVVTATGSDQFDQVIMACHSDQAIKLLAGATLAEQEILSSLEYQTNHVLLHSDASVMPRHNRSWASWNFRCADNQPSEQRQTGAQVTYCMNILQRLDTPIPVLVSLNSADSVREEKIMQEFHYDHPVYSSSSMLAQSRRDEICGKDRIHYCGAYWYNGFHEDGVRSALDVCARFGESL